MSSFALDVLTIEDLVRAPPLFTSLIAKVDVALVSFLALDVHKPLQHQLHHVCVCVCVCVCSNEIVISNEFSLVTVTNEFSLVTVMSLVQ